MLLEYILSRFHLKRSEKTEVMLKLRSEGSQVKKRCSTKKGKCVQRSMVGGNTVDLGKRNKNHVVGAGRPGRLL